MWKIGLVGGFSHGNIREQLECVNVVTKTIKAI
jgi:hypothetical protein